MDTQFRLMLGEALDQVAKATGKPADEVVSDGPAMDELRGRDAGAWAMGFLEGAAAALDLTVLELLDEMDMLPSAR